MDGSTARVLVVGRGQNRAQDLRESLGASGFEFTQTTPEEAVPTATASDADLVLLDYPLLDRDCLRLCRTLHSVSALPVVICSFSSAEADIVRAYEAGADDYLVMPVRPVEITARLRAVLRRAGERARPASQAGVLTAGDLEVRVNEHRVFLGGRELELSPIEFRLLAALVRQAGRAVSHSKLLSAVWGPEYVDCRNYLRLYIRYLRNKLEADPRAPTMILNEWGVGYRFEAPAA